MDLSSDKKNMALESVVCEGKKRTDSETSYKKGENQNPSDFETAIAATGYGKFNYILILVAIPCCLSCMFNSSTMSYVFPSAECDLNLSLQDKGTLNAATYAGMVITPIFWGFLADVLGRRKLLIFGFLMDSFFNLLCASSKSFVAIVVFKFIGGLIMCGPFAVLMSYISELHGLQHRSVTMISLGIFYSFSDIILPVLSWIIIPSRIHFTLIDNFLDYTTWQIFIGICALPSLIGGLSVLFLPESPKFLMSKGRNEEAMKVFKLIYSMNKRDSSEYPIKQLADEKNVENVSKSPENPYMENSLKNICVKFQKHFSQMSIMLQRPHLKNIFLTYFLQFGILFGLNTFRLWVPQLYVIITEFENQLNQSTTDIVVDPSLCEMIAFKVNNTQHIASSLINNATVEHCEPTIESDMYMNTTLIGIITLIINAVATIMINSVGNKNLLIGTLLISGWLGFSLYWAKSAMMVFIATSGYVAIASVATNALVSVTVSLFPTSIRTMNVSLMMMCGRLGGLLGNLLFPILMSLGCFPPFSMISFPLIVCCLVCFALPKTIKKPLQ